MRAFTHVSWTYQDAPGAVVVAAAILVLASEEVLSNVHRYFV